MSVDRFAVCLRFRMFLNPVVVPIYIAFSERHAYEWANARGWPKTYSWLVKPLRRREAEDVVLEQQNML